MLKRKMYSTEDKNFSQQINSTLDNFGFNKEIISFRAHHLNQLAENMNINFEQLTPFKFAIVGSAGEGFRHQGSDIDVLAAFKNTECSDKQSLHYHANLNILKTDYKGCAPGYTKVVLIKKSSTDIRHPFHFDMMYRSSEGHPYVHHNLEYFAGSSSEEVNGPAFSMVTDITSYIISGMDWVFSFYFIGKEHLRKWKNRMRFFSWPPLAVQNEVSKMEGYIVPVGDKLSDLKNLQWRICYTTGEKKLIENLNEPLKKLYILLKIVSKTLLKPVCKAITSYVAKNVVFWVAEGVPGEQLSGTCLLRLLQKSLYWVKYCLQNNHLPNYMIPKRNLLRGGVYGIEKKQIIEVLSGLINDGRNIIVKLPKLYKCMTYMERSPTRALQYRIWRDETEKQIMEFIVKVDAAYRKSYYLPLRIYYLLRDIDFKKVFKMLFTVVPEFPSLISEGKFLEIYNLAMARLEAGMLL